MFIVIIVLVIKNWSILMPWFNTESTGSDIVPSSVSGEQENVIDIPSKREQQLINDVFSKASSASPPSSSFSETPAKPPRNLLKL
jgi:hypothetical protein